MTLQFGNMINQLWKLSLLLGELIDKQPDNTIRGLVPGKLFKPPQKKLWVKCG